MAAALPPNWTKYTTEDGKDYFHNAVTNTTQWEKPEWNALAPESLSFHSSTSEVYQYRPGVSDLELNPRASNEASRTVGMAPQTNEYVEAAGKAPGGKLPTGDDTVSLQDAPGGRLGSSPQPYTGFGGSIVGGMLAATSEEDGGAGMSGVASSMLTWAQQFFDVSSDDVIKRLRLAMVPLQGQTSADTINEFRVRPDFWGPFWIATTCVLFLAATGNFARLLDSEGRSTFKADYGLVSFAASMIYGCLAAVPVLTRAILYATGHDFATISMQQMICVYGYSLAPIIPVSIVCLIPVNFIRWLAIIVGLGMSWAFMQGNLLKDLSIEAPTLKWKMGGLIGAAQVSIFLVYKMYFFSSA